ncbi:MAG: Beta-barrel assembly-enhancing protease [Cryomorphaceae bacterium]|nr:MAG: Beta-barrel assembly-enhancing protease [Cryomorphaceae bacterium]
MKKGIIIILCLLNLQAFAQWKSYYPEGKSKNNKEVKQKIDKGNFKFNTHLFNALKSKSLENYEQALEQFQKCITMDNKQALPFYESALINKGLGNLDLASEQAKIATEIEKNNRWYQLNYAEVLFANHDFKSASVEYKKLLLKEPGNKELYFLLADTYIYDNDFLKAIEVYDDLEQIKGIDKMVSMQKHKLYMQLEKKKYAIKELKNLLEKFPNEIEALEILSEVYLLNDEKEKAFDIFKQLAIIVPENGRIHLTLADYYRRQGDNIKSFEELKLAFKSIKLGIDVKVGVLASYFQLLAVNNIMKEQAYTLAKLLIEIHPNEVKPNAIYADILYTDNRFKEAKEQYLIVLEKDKTKSQVWSQVLFIQAEQNDFEGMLKTSEQALTYFSTDPLFYYFNGVANKWFKNYDIAINSLNMGVEFVLDNKLLLLEFYSSLADSYHAIKEHKLSDEYYEKSLVIDSNNVLVLNNYAYYLSLRKINLEKAKKMSYKCNELEKDNGTYQDTYAWILYELADYEQAKIWMQKSLANGSDMSAVVVEHYGDILYKLGNIEGAILEWKKAKNLGEASKFLDKKLEDGKLYE